MTSKKIFEFEKEPPVNIFSSSTVDHVPISPVIEDECIVQPLKKRPNRMGVFWCILAILILLMAGTADENPNYVKNEEDELTPLEKGIVGKIVTGSTTMGFIASGF